MLDLNPGAKDDCAIQRRPAGIALTEHEVEDRPMEHVMKKLLAKHSKTTSS
jgi:hypothetical protein